jgi:(p)ppGpp synthase/HD superfamily hydrolase
MQRFPRLHAALDYAAEAHQKQVRKGTSIAYLSHPLGVSSLVIEHGGDCDKLHNARAIATDLASGEDVFARFTGGRDGTLWYYRSLAEAFVERLGPERPLVIELVNTVERLCSTDTGT